MQGEHSQDTEIPSHFTDSSGTPAYGKCHTYHGTMCDVYTMVLFAVIIQ